MVPDDDDAGGLNRRGGIHAPGERRGERHRLLGPRPANPNAPPRPAHAKPRVDAPTRPAKLARAGPLRKRVLFVCIGNSCRSQMAEAFARAYGADVMEAHSAGVSPAATVAPLTKMVLAEWNLGIDDQFPKSLDIIRQMPFDVVVNMSGIPLQLPGARVIEWTVQDPIGQKESFYRAVASQLEGLVMGLVLDLRADAALRKV